uniref:Putative secreted protein n=1 Tax=Ixodes ricinus TaxID=34613 RepID=A0A6B0U2M9_IXORI
MSRGLVVRTHTTHAQLSSFPLSSSCALLSPLALSTNCVHCACVLFYSHRARTRNSPPLVSSPPSVKNNKRRAASVPSFSAASCDEGSRRGYR